MELQVYKNTTISETAWQFSKYFPFLKLEFFLYRHGSADEHFPREVYRGLYLEETSSFFKEGLIRFSPSTTIAELEQEFQIELGLAAKVYRRSGDMWVDTTQTSHLTLAKQNSMGAALAKSVRTNIHTLFL
jgi:hypothetical protein